MQNEEHERLKYPMVSILHQHVIVRASLAPAGSLLPLEQARTGPVSVPLPILLSLGVFASQIFSIHVYSFPG